MRTEWQFLVVKRFEYFVKLCMLCMLNDTRKGSIPQHLKLLQIHCHKLNNLSHSLSSLSSCGFCTQRNTVIAKDFPIRPKTTNRKDTTEILHLDHTDCLLLLFLLPRIEKNTPSLTFNLQWYKKTCFIFYVLCCPLLSYLVKSAEFGAKNNQYFCFYYIEWLLFWKPIEFDCFSQANTPATYSWT